MGATVLGPDWQHSQEEHYKACVEPRAQLSPYGGSRVWGAPDGTEGCARMNRIGVVHAGTAHGSAALSHQYNQCNRIYRDCLKPPCL